MYLLYIDELRVFAKQKLGMAFVHRHPWRYGRLCQFVNPCKKQKFAFKILFPLDGGGRF